jgi:hypothetical protein
MRTPSSSSDGAALALGRRPRERGDVRLFAATIDWLAALPFGVRPVQLPVDFIRISNELARLWDDPVELDRYFSEKESDRRGGRVGFPPLVAEELNALHVYSVRRRLGLQ